MARLKKLALDMEESITHFLDHFSLERLSVKELIEIKDKLDYCIERMQSPSHDLWLAVIRQTPAPLTPRFTYKKHKMAKARS